MFEKLTLKNIFLFDGIGAFVSAIFLGVALPQLQSLIGMPLVVLYTLAVWALAYSIYSISCYKFIESNKCKWLQVLIFLNLSYCLMTATLVVYFSSKLLILGYAYFLAEIAIIFGLILIERKIFLNAA